MKHADIQKIHEAGLITEEQRRNIVEHFHLSEEGGGKFLVIVSAIGGVLVTAGIILLISAHWNEIPRGVKIVVGMLLMLGTHGVGWWLREGSGKYPKTGETLHFIGSGLFLANIALLGQIYNIVSRPPNAFLLWWAGIAALPWLLRSKAQHILVLLAFGLWFGFEVNERDSWISCFDDARQILLYALLGLIYLGAGWLLRRTRVPQFAASTEKLGLTLFLIFCFPLTWKEFFGWHNIDLNPWAFVVVAAPAVLLLASGGRSLAGLDRQWRWTWLAAFAGMVIFIATVWFGCWQVEQGHQHYPWGESWNYLVGIVALFVFCLLQIQVGLQTRSRFLVNLGVVFIALDIFAAYCDLFGSMARTGVMFLISGVFLIVFGFYLEKKRRKLMSRIKALKMEAQ